MDLLHRFSAIGLASMLLAATVLLFPVPGSAENQQVPIHIEADRMVSHEQDNSVVFTGNVDARQGELLIRTDEMTAYYVQEKATKSGSGASKVDKLVCKGNVQISQGDWLGTGQRMDYYAKERKVILSGNAKAWQGQNMVAGKAITYFLDEGRSIVEGPVSMDGATGKSKPGRVKAVIQPGADKK